MRKINTELFLRICPLAKPTGAVIFLCCVKTDPTINLIDAYAPLVSERRQFSLYGATYHCFSSLSHQRIYWEVAHISPLMVNPTAVKWRVHFASHG